MLFPISAVGADNLVVMIETDQQVYQCGNQVIITVMVSDGEPVKDARVLVKVRYPTGLLGLEDTVTTDDKGSANDIFDLKNRNLCQDGSYLISAQVNLKEGKKASSVDYFAVLGGQEQSVETTTTAESSTITQHVVTTARTSASSDEHIIVTTASASTVTSLAVPRATTTSLASPGILEVDAGGLCPGESTTLQGSISQLALAPDDSVTGAMSFSFRDSDFCPKQVSKLGASNFLLSINAAGSWSGTRSGSHVSGSITGDGSATCAVDIGNFGRVTGTASFTIAGSWNGRLESDNSGAGSLDGTIAITSVQGDILGNPVCGVRTSNKIGLSGQWSGQFDTGQSIQVITGTSTITTGLNTLPEAPTGSIHVAVTTNDASYNPSKKFKLNEPIELQYSIQNNGPDIADAQILVTVYGPSGTPTYTNVLKGPLLSGMNNYFDGLTLSDDGETGTYEIEVVIVTDLLGSGGEAIPGGVAATTFQVT